MNYIGMMGDDTMQQRDIVDALDGLEDFIHYVSEQWTDLLGVPVEVDFMREPHRTYTGFETTRLVVEDGVYMLQVAVDGFTTTGFESIRDVEGFLERWYDARGEPIVEILET